MLQEEEKKKEVNIPKTVMRWELNGTEKIYWHSIQNNIFFQPQQRSHENG